MIKSSNSKEQDKFVIRLPDGLRDQLAVRSSHDGLSMNALAVKCLQSYLSQSDELDTLLEAVRALKRELEQKATNQSKPV